MTVYKKVTVNAVDVTTVLTQFRVEDTYGDAVTSAFISVLSTVDSLVVPTEGQTVKIFRKLTSDAFVDPTDLIFKGYLVKVNRTPSLLTLECKGMLYDAITTTINHVFKSTDTEAGKISEIFKTIINTYVGLTADGTTVQDSGTVNVLSVFKCLNAVATDRMKALADTIYWQYYYLPTTDKVYFEPVGFIPSTTILTVGTEIINPPKWEVNTQEMANDITIEGATQLVDTTELFTGDGVEDTFTLSHTPVSIIVYVGGVLKIGGLTNLVSDAQYNVNASSNEIVFTTGNIPPSSPSNISVTYSYPIPIPIHMTNPTSIASYGVMMKKYTLTDVVGIADAETRGKAILDEVSVPKVHAVLWVKQNNSSALKAGEMVNIVDGINDVSGEYLINRIVRHWARGYDEVYVGDKEFRLSDLQTDILTRIQRLEEETTIESQFGYELVQLAHTIPFRRKSLTSTVYLINDSFILGHRINGCLGRGQPLDDFESGVASWSGTNCTLSEQEDI